MHVSDMIDPSFSYRLIATLIHFLWQGCLIALVTVPADWLLRHAPASRRYALHATAMTSMVACVAVTFFQMELPDSDPATSAESAGITPVTEVIPSNPGAADPADLHQTLPPSFVGVETPLSELPSVATSSEPVLPPNVREEHSIVNGDLWRGFQRWTPQIALSYFACCALMLARLARGTWVAHRLRRTATTVRNDSIIAMLHQQSKQLGLRVMPQIAWCAEVSIPLVIGIFKPMILLPAAAATGLSPDQLQALITHELAHICRYDLLVNLLQRIVESMLFFHPAVWYISRHISSEREHACDEMVLATGCERLRYADALVRMAELSTLMRRPEQSVPTTSLAAAGANSSEFKRRVLKVLSVPTTSQLRPSRIALLVVLTLILSAALFASRRQYSALAETSPSPTETETTPQDGLEFLKPYPKLHGLSLKMTESQFLEIIKQQDLRSRKSAEAGKVKHRIALGDDHTLIVMFDKDGKCGGIQRVLGEDKDPDEPASVLKRPQGKESQLLFQKWQRTARTSGDIPGGAIGPLVRVIRNFVKNNPTHEGSPKFAEMLKRIDVTRDWSHDEAVKLLDDVAAIYPSLPEWVEDEPRFTLGGDVAVGKPLPDDLKDAPWGEAQPNGLRAAWLLVPRENEHRLNTALKSRVLFHNSGKNAVVFRALTWNQSGEHKAHDAQGQAINIHSIWWTTIPRTFVCRLAPGEFIEVTGAGIGVGPNKDDEDWRDARSEVRVGSWIEANAGDDVTFTPAAIDGDGRESARPDDDDTPATPKSWWLKFIKDRLSLDAPLPADANERGRLLDRAVHDLFGNTPTNDELAEFKNDTTPDALDALAKRLAERTGFETFSGMLTSGPTKFRVLPVDPDAAKKPRSAKGPGQYPLGGNTAFVVTRRPIGERIVNEARLNFAPTDATKPAPLESHRVPLPDGYDTWIAAWMRGSTVMWVAQIDADQKTSIRRYDFTNPVSVLETVITELKPEETLPETILDVFSAHFRVRREDNNGAGRDPKPEKCAATLPNGVEIELAGVAMANVSYADQSKRRKADDWWRANGTRLQAPPMPLFTSSVDEVQKDFREFAIKLTGDATAITASHVSWTPHPQNGSYGQGGWDTSAGKPGFLKLQHLAGFNDEKPVAVHVFVSDLPFGPAWLIDGNGLALPQKPADAKTESLRKLIHIVGVEKNVNETIFRSKRLTAYLDQRLEFNLRAIDKKDQSHASSESRGSEAGEGRVFKVAAADIKHFEIRLRPMTQMVTFENVSLVPGQVTDVKVKVEAIDPLAPQPAIARDPSESAALKKLVEDLAILLPEHWHPRQVGERTIQMMPGSYLKAEDSPHVILVFTNDKTRPVMKWERKDGQYEYLGETPHGHGHLFVSMKITGSAANPQTMKLFDWPDAAEFVKVYLKGDQTRITEIRKRSKINSTISRNALASGSDAEVGTKPDAGASRLKTSQHFTRNGLRYELEAVAFASLDQPGGAKRKDNDWWRADGTMLDAAPANLAAITVPKDQANFREFVLRAHVVDGQKIRRHSAGEFWVPPSSGQWFRTSRLAGPDALKFQLMKRIEVEKPAAFALYFTDEPWSLSATLDLNGKLHPNAELDAKYLALVQQFEVRIVEKLPTTTIVKVHPTSDDARRTLVALSAIKLDGQTTRAIEPTTDELYLINAPASEIEAFQISLRRMTHKATFENVATLPGQKTEPTVSLEPLDTLVSVTFRKDGKTLGILSDMSVTQLEETLAVLQHDLNSETSELIIDTQLATTFAEVERIVKRLKASGWKWPTITVTSVPKSEKDIAAKNVFVKEIPTRDKYSATLPNGDEVELVSVAFAVASQADGTRKRKEVEWWRADGTKLDGPPPFKLSDVRVNADQTDFREFAFRLKGFDDIVPLTTLVTWTPRPNRGSSGATGSDAGFVNLQHVAGFTDQTPVNVHFFYSNLPTQGAGVIDIDGKMPPLPQADSGIALRKIESLRKLIQIVGVEKNKDETILRFQMPPNHSELMDVNFVAIDVNGNVRGADRWHNTPLENRKVFRLPAAEISHFDIRLKLMTHKITFENVSLVPGQKTDVTVKVEPIPEGKFGKLPTETAEISEMEKTVGLEILKLYPKLNGLSLSMTESQFLEIAKQLELKPRKSIDGDKVTHHISLGDGHTLIVRFDKDANCSAIQRARSEEAKQHAVEVRLVGGPRSEPLPKVKVEFTSGHGSDQKSFGTFTTDDAGWIRATLPVGFYYLHLSSEQERPYLTFEKFWTGNGQGLSRSLNVRVTESEVEKWLDGKRRESGFEAATNERPARITFTLEPAVELLLRAIDIDTGKGIPGVEFYEEVAAGEDWGHPIYAENIGAKFTDNAGAPKGQKNLTDNEGYLRRWIGEKTEESKFGAWTMPGYELVEPKGEISLLVKLGQKRVEQDFKFRRVQ